VTEGAVPSVASRPPKCVVWDLDGTLWEGTLAEGENIRLFPGRAALVRSLDASGILQSIASRNNAAGAAAALARHGLGEYFLHPQIHWGDKSASLVEIARILNVGLDALVLVDDDPYERAEVGAALAEVRCLAPEALEDLARAWLHAATPVTPAARLRRHSYRAELARAEAGERFVGSRSEFLAWLGLELSVRSAGPSDLARVLELAHRANRMSSAGRPFDSAFAEKVIALPDHRLVIAGLRDRFGDYGTIGVALLRAAGAVRRLLLFLVSCRVMNRGTASVFLNWILREAVASGERVEAEFQETASNRPLYITLRFAGFSAVAREGGMEILAHDGKTVRPCPAHVRLTVEGGSW